MPTINGPWLASDRVRFVCDYTVTKTNGGVDATISATIRLQTRYSLYDSVNKWSISGGLGSKSGSNINFSHGNNGGTTTIGSVSRTGRTSNVSVSVSVTGLEAYGSISQSFTIPIGALARAFSGLYADQITQTSFRARASHNGNGTGNNIQVQYNTSASTSGAQTKTAGSWTWPIVTGLQPGTRYYFRMRASTSQYGWGPWSTWANTTTLPGVYVRVSGTWRTAIPYVKVSGSWRQAERRIRVSGTWR